MTISVIKPHVINMCPPHMLQAQLEVVEEAGRVCYKTEGKMGDGTAETFIRSIISRGHESVIEHGNATIKFVGDRSMSHQLVRHRICAFSQESQRYCDYGKLGFQVVCPPSIGKLEPGHYWQQDNGDWTISGGETYSEDSTVGLWLSQVNSDYERYKALRAEGVKAEDARSVLPNATKTEVVVTANWRQWRHMFQHRALNPRAQWQIRELMLDALKGLSTVLPAVFGDLGN